MNVFNAWRNRDMPLKFIIALLAAFAFAIGSFGAADAAAKKRAKKASRPSVRVLTVRPADPYAVYWAGSYVGSDVDPNIRFQLLREFQFQMNNR